jgi:hypothetical protein
MGKKNQPVFSKPKNSIFNDITSSSNQLCLSTTPPASQEVFDLDDINSVVHVCKLV